MNEPPPAKPPREAVPSVAIVDERVAQDSACKECGYNLHSLPVGGACPECGTPIEYSLHGSYLAFAPVTWINRLRRGLTLMILSLLLSVLGGLIFGVWVATKFVSTGAIARGPAAITGVNLEAGTLALLLAALPVTCLQIAGFVLVTTRSPADPPQTRSGATRAWIRRYLWVYIAVLLGGVLAYVPASFLAPDVRAWLYAASQPASLGVGILFLILLIHHLGYLMGRIPNSGLARYARIVFWGLLISSIPTIAGQILVIPASAQSMAVLQGAAPLPTAPYGPTTAPAAPGSVTVSGRNISTFVFPGATSAPAASEPAPTATAPVAAPFGAGLPRMGAPFIVGQLFASCGSCVFACFAIAGFVLLFLVRGALGAVARRAGPGPVVGPMQTAGTTP